LTWPRAAFSASDRPHGKVPTLDHAACQSETEAEACFRGALVLAREQRAKSLELHASRGGSNVRAAPTKRSQCLAEIYGWFTEGFDAADLKDAKELLDELQG
jgi:hypothetical protein